MHMTRLGMQQVIFSLNESSLTRTEPAAAEYAARQQLDPDCFQLSSIGRTATRDFRNGVTVKESGAIALSPSFSE